MPQTPVAPILTDGIVTLRAHRVEDVDRVFEQCQDPLSQAWTTVPVPYTREMAEGFVGELMPNGWADDTEWAFAIEVDGAFGGTVSLRNEGDGRAEVAYGSHPAIRGTGAVERALRLLLEWGFEQQGLETVMWRANKGNWSSRKLAWRLGFSFEGTVRRWLPQRGELYDAWVGTLLRDDPREPRTTWLDVPRLAGEGFVLRRITESDASRIQEACSEERSQTWLGQLPAPYSLQDALDYVERRRELEADGEAVTWAVADPDDDRILATIGWFNWTPGVEVEVGFWTHPDARGRGLMTAATRLVTGHVFATLGLQRVTAYAAIGNTASRHVIESSGFRQYGVERLGVLVRDGRADMALYDVTASEWAALSSSEGERSSANATTSTTNPASANPTPTTNGDR